MEHTVFVLNLNQAFDQLRGLVKNIKINQTAVGPAKTIDNNLSVGECGRFSEDHSVIFVENLF